MLLEETIHNRTLIQQKKPKFATMNILKKVLSFPILVLVKIYQWFISPLTPQACRYHPTCSNYMIEALRIWGPFKGTWLGLKRISSCHPWGGHGDDPVPEKRVKQFTGKLYLYSEQGMEGGYLSIIDGNFIHLKPAEFIQENSQVYDDASSGRKGIAFNMEMHVNDSWIPARDPILDDSDYMNSSLYKGEEHGDFEADKRLMKKYNFKLVYIKEKADNLYGAGNWEFTKPNSEIQLENGKRIMMGGTPESIPQRPYVVPSSCPMRVSVKWEDGTIEKERISNTLFVEQWDFEGLQKLKKNDYLKVLDPINQEIIAEGKVKNIPLNIFSHTIDGHFKKQSQKWKEYFEEGYVAELNREG